MFFDREDYVIVMRTFWPVSPVVGEGMMQVSERLACEGRCRVVTQDQFGLRDAVKELKRGQNVAFSPVYALSNSSSKMLTRVLDLLWFTLAVFFVLLLRRPRVVYVATDPPLLVPVVVALYAKLFRASYVYHVQDIHPEATGIVFSKLKKTYLRYLYRFFRYLDGLVVKNAAKIITLTPEMANSLTKRGEISLLSITYINNPAAPLPFKPVDLKYDYSFVGNAGRLQRIPLLISAIRQYLQDGGNKKFAFAGAGVMSKDLRRLSDEFPDNVEYFGKVPVEKAAQITLASQWAMLPIEDEVCLYAFPSKASTYAVSGKSIVAICGFTTSVGQWVRKHNLGLVVNPDVSALMDFFNEKNIDQKKDSFYFKKIQKEGRGNLIDQLSTDQFVSGVVNVLKGAMNLSKD
ncbi:glycosyltransferase [Thalassospira sp. UBA1131]|uniref:glycosyltransferase n=1 Tax=Thalassospira sp. UBA1131 TaxID=1947672 RepID=UPI0025CC31FD|nr:glycosyltransferase [Thalassospira sp. UBA1131]